MRRVNLIAPDGLSREYWEFDLDGGGSNFIATLKAYGIERRSVPKGMFRKAQPMDRWSAYDERRYTSGITRPTEIPKEIMWKLMSEASCLFRIGFNNAECEKAIVPFSEITARI